MTAKMEIRGVSKTFHARGAETAALERCDLEIDKGEFVTVVGPSGCGKSTLMMIAAGLEAPSTGEILVDGAPAGPAGPRRTVVFQRFALFPSETVAQNIAFGLRVARLERAEIERRVDEQLQLMGLTRFARAYPHELSGGMQQRVAIARALVVRPEILLMDERSALSMRKPAPCCRKRSRGCSASCTIRCSSSRTASRRRST
jgi:NitT/TauT family transport system ATP-binding protein